MPGGIDPHVHLKWYSPHPDGSVTYTDGPEIVGRAALFGGTTTMIDFVRWTHGKTIQQAIEERHRDWTHNCHCDYSFHVMVEGALPPEIFGQLAEVLRAGYPTVKMFTTDITPSRRGRMVDFGDIWEVFKVVADAHGLCVIHGEDNDIVMHMYDKLIRENRAGFENMAEVHNAMSEDLSFRRVLGLAKNVPGIALYLQPVQDLSVESRVSRTQYQFTVEDPDPANLSKWVPKLVERLKQTHELRDVASDQQDRGLRETVTGDGTRTRNPTFGGRIKHAGGHVEVFGYGKASIAAGMSLPRRFRSRASTYHPDEYGPGGARQYRLPKHSTSTPTSCSNESLRARIAIFFG